MAKIKLTKGELKHQRDSLAQFKHYLPTLQLKKQQLQMKINEAKKLYQEQVQALRLNEEQIKKWSKLLGDPLLSNANLDLAALLKPTDVKTSKTNIAGATVPIFEEVVFPAIEYDFYLAPLWIFKGIEILRAYVSLNIECTILEEQIRLLGHELRVTTQRVNLFEKVKIPECQDNIRQIRIYLGDQQANAVGIGKVAKKKINEKMEAMA